MCGWLVWNFVLILASTFHQASGLVCLHCNNIAKPRLCTRVAHCNDGDVCKAQRFVNEFGETEYDIGCSPKNDCHNVASAGQYRSCTQCCSQDLCTNDACGEQGYGSLEIPICYGCTQPTPYGRCHDITFCTSGQCYFSNNLVALKLTYSTCPCTYIGVIKLKACFYQNECNVIGKLSFGEIVYTSQCMSKYVCMAHHSGGSIVGKRHLETSFSEAKRLNEEHEETSLTDAHPKRSHEIHECDICCSTHLCNSECSTSVNGAWSNWGTWNQCSRSCDSGTQSRDRSCDSPLPFGGGANCSGSNYETRGCFLQTCRVDGSWGQWGEWSQCSRSCDNGTLSRGRSCDTPPPSGGGANCAGLNYQSRGCFVFNCPADCSDLLKSGRSWPSGVYTMVTWQTHTQVDVFCDMDTDGGGWTVFQHRVNGSVDFYMNFSSYENGFGSLYGEFWLGLKYLHELTSRRNNNTLRIDLQAPNGTRMYDVYEGFSVGPGSDYTLHVGIRTDSLNVPNTYILSPFHDGQAFTTYDHDMDHREGSNCAIDFHGAWWYNNCYYANLNGHYLIPGTSDTSGMIYTAFIGSLSLKESKMMFK